MAEKELKDYLTRQILTEKQSDSFKLVAHAIEVVSQMITSDRRCRVPTRVRNRAYQALLEIVEGVDDLESKASDLPEHEPLQVEPIETPAA